MNLDERVPIWHMVMTDQSSHSLKNSQNIERPDVEISQPRQSGQILHVPVVKRGKWGGNEEKERASNIISWYWMTESKRLDATHNNSA